MNRISTLFQSKKDLCQWWAAVTGDPRFDDVLLHVRSMMLEFGPTTESLEGARRYENALVSIGQAVELGDDFPSPGLHHDLDELPASTQLGEMLKKKV